MGKYHEWEHPQKLALDLAKRFILGPLFGDCTDRWGLILHQKYSSDPSALIRHQLSLNGKGKAKMKGDLSVNRNSNFELLVNRTVYLVQCA
jgi:hypothetical protein